MRKNNRLFMGLVGLLLLSASCSDDRETESKITHNMSNFVPHVIR